MSNHPEIPIGMYCYTVIGSNSAGRLITKVCPHWSIRPDKPHQLNGYCNFLKKGDWEMDHMGLLWDQVKECSVNYKIDEAGYPPPKLK